MTWILGQFIPPEPSPIHQVICTIQSLPLPQYLCLGHETNWLSITLYIYFHNLFVSGKVSRLKIKSSQKEKVKDPPVFGKRSHCLVSAMQNTRPTSNITQSLRHANTNKNNMASNEAKCESKSTFFRFVSSLFLDSADILCSWGWGWDLWVF